METTVPSGPNAPRHGEVMIALLRVGPVLATTSTEDRFEFGLTVFLASLAHLDHDA